jgi:hypothetical protein
VEIVALARRHGCTGIICGHIHTPADKRFGDFHYLNSGDWVESLTAIVEHLDGRFELIEFTHFKQLFPMPEAELDLEGEAADPLPALGGREAA